MPTSLYFHIPFCKTRCGYCDFVTFAGFEPHIPAYLNSLEKQVRLFGSGESVHTIFFGGGTPSLIPPAVYKELFKTVYEHFDVLPDAEITLEANPGTVDARSLNGYREMGFNRISFGMQSARPDELQLLERRHETAAVENAVYTSRKAGFDNISLDLIYGLPRQTVEHWKESLTMAIDLEPEHLSLYSLIIDDDTPLAKRIERGEIPAPDDDIAADLFELSCRTLEENRFDHYELSNWARDVKERDLRCRHNLQYWRLQPYLGFGCGAVGFLPAEKEKPSRPGQLMQNENWITSYIRQVEGANQSGDRSVFLKPVSEEFEMETRMFMGFRLIMEGINPAEFKRRFRVELEEVFGSKLVDMLKKELIEKTPTGNYRLKRSTWFTSNQVLREFADEPES